MSKKLDLKRFLRRQKYFETALKGLLTASQAALCAKYAKQEFENANLQSEDETLFLSIVKQDENNLKRNKSNDILSGAISSKITPVD